MEFHGLFNVLGCGIINLNALQLVCDKYGGDFDPTRLQNQRKCSVAKSKVN